MFSARVDTIFGAAAFSGTAGELRAFTTTASTLVRGDTDGDGIPDLEIFLNGVNRVPGERFRPLRPLEADGAGPAVR